MWRPRAKGGSYRSLLVHTFADLFVARLLEDRLHVTSLSPRIGVMCKVAAV